MDVELRVEEAVTRGLADGVVVSGTGTGRAVDADRLEAAADACEHFGVPLFVGSGVTSRDVSALLSVADGAIVGTALKEGGVTDAPVNEARVRDLVSAARS